MKISLIKFQQLLGKDFYVNDLVKLVHTIKDATSIVHNIIAMCAASGFNLKSLQGTEKNFY